MGNGKNAIRFENVDGIEAAKFEVGFEKKSQARWTEPENRDDVGRIGNGRSDHQAQQRCKHARTHQIPHAARPLEPDREDSGPTR